MLINKSKQFEKLIVKTKVLFLRFTYTNHYTIKSFKSVFDFELLSFKVSLLDIFHGF